MATVGLVLTALFAWQALAPAQSAGQDFILDFNGPAPQKFSHPQNSWAVRIGPFSPDEKFSNSTSAITRIDRGLLDGKTLGGEMLLVVRFSPDNKKTVPYLEISSLTRDKAQNTCAPFLKKSYECSAYDLVLLDVFLRAFLKQLDFVLKGEIHKVAVEAYTCHEQAVSSGQTKNLSGCFMLEYSHMLLLSQLDDEMLKGQANLVKANLDSRLADSFRKLNVGELEQASLIQEWISLYSEVVAWSQAKTLDVLVNCIGNGIRTEKCS
jgi:hypothetical protein